MVFGFPSFKTVLVHPTELITIVVSVEEESIAPTVFLAFFFAEGYCGAVCKCTGSLTCVPCDI